jgi:CubicO group peptidase (beta-lactamase class C family)
VSACSPMDALAHRRECAIRTTRSMIRIVLRTLCILIILSAANVGTQSAAARQQQVAPDALATQQVRGPLGRDLDSLLTSYEAHGFAGTVLIVRRGEVVLLKGYGFADIPRRARNGPETRFEMNSMTKMFTGVSILQLASAGKIRLDAPIGQYLGPFPASKSDATVEQLAMHTAGLAVAGTQLAGNSRGAFVAAMKSASMESPPGARYRYTNAGYSLLAAIIEVASGQTFEDYLRQHVFTPASMRSPVLRTQVPVADTLCRLSIRSHPRTSQSLRVGDGWSRGRLGNGWRYLSMGGRRGTQRRRTTAVSRVALLATSLAIPRGVWVACLPCK